MSVTQALHGAAKLPEEPRTAQWARAFKGAQPATRYEMASVVARALVTVDAEKASKQDLELLKKLVMEFKDELDALGVKVDGLDKRVAVLEENLGGWKLYGQLYFDAKFYDSDNETDHATENAGLDSKFGFGRARFFLTKQIDENTSMLIRMDTHTNKTFAWNRFYVDTKLPWDIDFRFGRLNFDWESDLGLYDPYTVNNDAMFGDWTVDGFQFVKTWGNFKATGIVARNAGLSYSYTTPNNVTVDENNAAMIYALKLGYESENWMLGAMGYFMQGDNGGSTYVSTDIPTLGGQRETDIATYGVYAGYSFTPAIQLKGVYYWQNIDIDGINGFDGDDPTSWKAILDVKQDLLKFTALWVEYAQQDNTFLGTNSYNYMHTGGDTDQDGVMANQPLNDNTAKIWNIIANQQWNDKFSSYVRYFKADWDTPGLDDTEDWTVGIRYQYTPAIQFKLEYDMIDYGDGVGIRGDDNVLRFRTTVNF